MSLKRKVLYSNLIKKETAKGQKELVRQTIPFQLLESLTYFVVFGSADEYLFHYILHEQIETR